MSKIIFMCGVVCSGKSTYIKENLNNYKVLSRDDIVMELGKHDDYTKNFDEVNQEKVDELFNNRFRELLYQRESFIIDRTNLSKKSRRRFLSHIPQEYEKEIIVFITSLNTIFKRNEERKNKKIPKNVIYKMINKFVFPSKSEGFDSVKTIYN